MATWGGRKMLVLILLAALIYTILSAKDNGLWDAVWNQIFAAVAVAEEKWKASGSGDDKRRWVVDTVTAYVTARVELNWIQRLALASFVGGVADAIVNEINEQLGKSWVDRVREFEARFAGRVPGTA